MPPAPKSMLAAGSRQSWWAKKSGCAARLICMSPKSLPLVTAAFTGPAVTVNVWTHVACTYDGTTARLYENGQQVAMATGTGNLTAGNANGSHKYFINQIPSD